MIDVVYAMGANGGAGGAASGGGGAFVQLMPLVLIFAVFYFLLIRPQQKKAKEHQQMITNLKKGDRVITNGGIYGRITNASDPNILTIEIADKVKVKCARGNIASLAQETQAALDKKEESEKDE